MREGGCGGEDSRDYVVGSTYAEVGVSVVVVVQTWGWVWAPMWDGGAGSMMEGLGLMRRGGSCSS